MAACVTGLMQACMLSDMMDGLHGLIWNGSGTWNLGSGMVQVHL
jgi:hypothetical protein